VKLAFIDAEYTGEHAYTTLVSLGVVTLEGKELYLPLNDYDETQVTDWLRDNVLALIPHQDRITSAEAYRRLSAFLETYSSGERVHLVSAGLGSDLLLTYELFRHARPELRYFHALHCLPPYLNHAQHYDLNTMMTLVGLDPDMSRDAFVDHAVPGRQHHALHDAQVVRLCFLRIIKHPAMAAWSSAIDGEWR
jgi:3' exoribonuclease, RNase T-like